MTPSIMKKSMKKSFGLIDPPYNCIFRMWKEKDTTFKGHSLFFDFYFEFETERTELELEKMPIDTRWFETYLREAFSNTFAVELEDPLMDLFLELEELGGCDLRFMDKVGGQAFAEMVFNDLAPIVLEQTDNKVRMTTVLVSEVGDFKTLGKFTDLDVVS